MTTKEEVVKILNTSYASDPDPVDIAKAIVLLAKKLDEISDRLDDIETDLDDRDLGDIGGN